MEGEKKKIALNVRAMVEWFDASFKQKSEPLEYNTLTTPVLEENHTPVLEENHTPLLEENHTPLLEENHTPELSENNTPELSENNTPLLEENNTPELSENNTPELSEHNNRNLNELVSNGTVSIPEFVENLNKILKNINTSEPNDSAT